jgi:3-oxo-5-alpha-steroid 4-dehydrogenase 1
MNTQTLNWISYAWIGIALIVHITMFFIKAPFGRHTTEKWGLTINNKLGWFIMELPSLGIMIYFLITGTQSFTSYVWILFSVWIFHYLNRTIIYPLRIKSTPKKIPLAIVTSAIFFNLINAGLNGYYLAEMSTVEQYSFEWLTSTHFMIGAILFISGMFINWKSDSMLISLRKEGETGYTIPKGFLFNYISSPNLFGEIIEWLGFALMAWNLPGLTFIVWTCANLIPRAKNHHDWYHSNFQDYPKERKIVFPFLY